MPILFSITGSLGEPSRKVSIASRYILRAMRISPRISGESTLAGWACCDGRPVLVLSTIAFGGDCATAEDNPAARSRVIKRLDIRAHPLPSILDLGKRRFKPAGVNL